MNFEVFVIYANTTNTQRYMIACRSLLRTRTNTHLRRQIRNKCGNLGFESERYVYFKKRKQTFILFLIMTEMLFYEHMDSFMFP